MNYKTFYAAFNASVKKGNPNTKEETIREFTAGRTESLKGLSFGELQEVTRRLNELGGTLSFTNDLQGTKADNMRKSIIAIFRTMGKTVNDAKTWAGKQGANGVKKDFNKYTPQELYILIQVAEKIKADTNKVVRNKIAAL